MTFSGSRFLSIFASVGFGALGMFPAAAQNVTCEGLRAELAALDRSSQGSRNQRYDRAVQRQRAELQRTAAYARSIGCDRQRFLIFGQDPPPQCSHLNSGIARMRANLAALEAQADRSGSGGASDARRRQLLSAIQQYCQPQQRTIIDMLFGSDDRGPTPVPDGAIPDAPAREQTRGYGGGRAVCVRMCDGFFFPLATARGGRNEAQEMCQALCPASETQLFFLDRKGEIDGGASARGEPYEKIPNAFRFRTSFDATCSCRKPGQTWADALRDAEELIGRRKGDVVVTAEKAEELSRPEAPRRSRKTRDAADEESDEAAAAARGASAPTAGNETSGIGSFQPRRTSESVSGRSEKVLDIRGTDGQERRVRIVAPGMSGPARQ